MPSHSPEPEPMTLLVSHLSFRIRGATVPARLVFRRLTASECKMIKYPDGTEAHVGDCVSLSHNTDRGVVRYIVDSVEQAKAWNLEKIGLMIYSTVTGMTFYPIYSLDRDEIRFISRSVA